MPDREKSSSPPSPPESPPPPSDESAPSSWEDNPTFRETFLLHLAPDLHPGVRQAGRGIFATALEMELPPLPRPWTHMRLRAVAADLRFLQSFLEAVAADRFEASLSEEESRLAERAESWAMKLHQIARRMEEATS
ncbi:MAG TPA: hypothetical protein VLF66_10670 [Thermoanaerobaculia bacterium]|nr:hypothetical protein [Thermoanaerobaculia bacterium]